jgi:predicted SnoaL-like aldol condensation-catalyzing enzyme
MLGLAAATTSSFGATSQVEERHKQIAATFLAAAMVGDFDRVAQYLAPNFKTHDFHIAKGNVDGLRAAFQAMAKAAPQLHVEISKQREFVSGDYVIVHYLITVKHGTGQEQHIGAEIFEFSHGKIVEHWNADQPVPAQAANSNGVF